MQTAKALFIRNGRLKATADLEIARSVQEKTKGLSGRVRVPWGTGMVFDSVGAYWMKDVHVPLDIAFADAKGKILEVLNMPVSKSQYDLPLYRPSVKGASQAFEFPACWLQKQGLGVGDQIAVLEN